SRGRTRSVTVRRRFYCSLLDPVEPTPPERRELDRPVQQHLRDDDRGEEAHGDSDAERECEAPHRTGAEQVEDPGRQHRREVRIEDRRERALATFLDGDTERLARAQLFLESLECD